MNLKAIIDDMEYTLNVPSSVLADGAPFFDQLDRDMDNGWQMSREWVADPNREQRCQIVADKLLSALEKENHKVGMLMAGYLLSRMPGLEAVEFDVQGEIQNNSFLFAERAAAAGDAASARTFDDAAAPPAMPSGLGKLEAMAQAGNDVTKVFKVGKGWRFSVYDHVRGIWEDSPLISGRDEAEQLRQQAFKERYEQLQQDARAETKP